MLLNELDGHLGLYGAVKDKMLDKHEILLATSVKPALYLLHITRHPAKLGGYCMARSRDGVAGC